MKSAISIKPQTIIIPSQDFIEIHNRPIPQKLYGFDKFGKKGIQEEGEYLHILGANGLNSRGVLPSVRAFSITFSDFATASMSVGGGAIELGASAVVSVSSIAYYLRSKMGTMATNPTFTLRMSGASNIETFMSKSKSVDNGCDNNDNILEGSESIQERFNFGDDITSLSFKAERITGSVTQSCENENRKVDCVVTGYIIGDAEIGTVPSNVTVAM